jgi:hypothetical protein
VWAIDALVFELPVLSPSALLISALFCVYGVAQAAGGQGQLILRTWSKRVLIWALVLTGVYGTRALNNSLAEQRLKRVVAAIELYRVRNGHYPATLRQLAPQYVPYLLVAKYTLRTSHFEYDCASCDLQAAEALPEPISVTLENGLKLYNFRQKRWAFVGR